MIRFDAEDGALRLGGDHLEALLLGLRSPSAPDPAGIGAEEREELERAWADLIAAGVVDPNGQPAETLAPRCEALRTPWLAVQLNTIGPAGTETHQLWTQASLGVAAGHIGEGWYDLIPITPEGIPAALFRLGRLGTRGHPAPADIAVPSTVFTGLFEDGHAQADQLAGALEPTWPDAAEQVRGENWRILQVDTAWAPALFGDPGRAQAVSQALLVLDTMVGYFAIVPGEPTSVRAITPTDLWEILIGITLPPDDLDPTLLTQADAR